MFHGVFFPSFFSCVFVLFWCCCLDFWIRRTMFSSVSFEFFVFYLYLLRIFSLQFFACRVRDYRQCIASRIAIVIDTQNDYQTPDCWKYPMGKCPIYWLSLEMYTFTVHTVFPLVVCVCRPALALLCFLIDFRSTMSVRDWTIALWILDFLSIGYL